MSDSTPRPRNSYPILQRVDDDSELELFVGAPEANQCDTGSEQCSSCGLIDVSSDLDANEHWMPTSSAGASSVSGMPDHHPMASDSIEPSLCHSIDEDPRLRTRAGRIWSRAPDGLVVPVLIVLLPVWLPLALLDEGRRWFLQQFLLGYLGGRPKPRWGYGASYPITPRRSIRDDEKVLRVLHWAFQQRGQEWASLIMVRDASSGRLRRGLTEVMAMLEDSGELQVQWFRTNEALGDLAAHTIPHGARQHGLLRAIELYLEFRDEASRIRRFDFKHHFAYRTRMFALALDYAMRQHLDLRMALEAAALERSTAWRHYVSWAADQVCQGEPAPWGLPVSRCGLLRFEPQFLAMLKSGVEHSNLPSVLKLVVRM